MPLQPPAPSLRRVLLVEDQTAIRQMMAVFISAIPGFQVVGEASDNAAALQIATKERPDLVVLDWMLARQTGLVFLRDSRSLPKPPAVLVFSANTTLLAVREAFAHGALGYIEKTASFAEFNTALRALAEGRVYLGPAVGEAMKNIVHDPQCDQVGSPISSREREVLRLLAAGRSSKEIADALHISHRTVGNHRANIIRKTGLHSVAELTLHACELGIGPLNAPSP